MEAENSGLLILGGPGFDGETPGGGQSPGHDEDSIRDITARTGGRSIEQVCKRLGEYLRGWKEYFHLADTPRIFDNLDRWIRRRLRALHLKHWGQQSTVYRAGCVLGE